MMGSIENQSSSVNAIFSCILTRSDQYLNSRSQTTCSLSSLARRVHIDLPEPPTLLPALVAAGARPEVAQAMQAAYYQRACESRQQTLAMISRVCSKLAQFPSTCSHPSDETIVAAFQNIYLKKLNTWISEGVALLQERGSSVLRCREDNERIPTKISKAFNHEYVPLLEHFFDENPFPTHADKVFLAKKSSMTYRQIHVWFQNRRNRTKKVLHKKPITEGTTIPLNTLICKMGRFAVPPITRLDVPSDRNTPVSPSTEVYNALDCVAPPHAFPTTYPPTCEYDPFPSVPAFPTLEWPRRPILSREQPYQSIVDVGELTEKFSRLNVWDDSHSRSRRKAGREVCDGSAATSAITVKPSSAPHPACIRTFAVVPAPSRTTFQSIPAPASSLRGFRSPSPDSPMMTLIPRLTDRRKIAPLPKQIPSRPHPTLDCEIVRSSSRCPALTSSRTPSFTSEASMQDSRFTYNRSSSSSTVTTPEPPSSPFSPPLSHPT